MFVKLSSSDFSIHSKRLFTLGLPILITQFCQAAFGVIDAIMAGRVSALDLASVSIGAGLWLPVILLTMGILMATTPLIGEVVGRNEYNDVAHITQQSLWAALGMGIFGIFIIKSMPLVFNLMGVPANIQPLATQYLNSIAYAFPAVTLYTVMRCYCEALDRPSVVTVISLIGIIADIPLNYMFIYGKFGAPAMGGPGCGVATAIVLWLNLFLLAAYINFSKHKNFIKTRFLSHFVLPHKKQISTLLKLGLPIGVSIFFEASLFSLASLVISPLGELSVASHQVALSVTSQMFMLPMSISMALTIMIANRYGEKNLLALKQVQTTGLIWATLIATATMLVVIFYRDFLVGLFTNDVQVKKLAALLLFYSAAYQIFDAWQVSIAGVLRGIQDTNIPMYITLFCYWGVALPMGTYLVRYTDIGAQGFWMALVVGLLLASILLFVRLKQQQARLFTMFSTDKY